MRNTTIATIIIVALILNLNCLKEEQQPQIVKAGTTAYTIEDITLKTDIRYGEKLPLDFPTSQVNYNLFVQGTPQTAFNQNLMDSIKYFKLAGSGVNPLNMGVTFRKYYTVKYFKDGSNYQDKVYAPEYLGELTVIVPNVANNQLNVNNPFNYITIEVGKRNETYFDHKCGTVKKRYFYTEFANLDSVGYYTIDGDRCTSNVFSYKLIL